MTRRRWALAGIAVASLVWALGGEWVSIHAGIAENHFLDALAGLSFFVAGIVALDRRQGNRIGPLMLASGASWFCGNWENLRWPVWGAPLLVFGSATAAFVAHVALGYSNGRLATRYERVTVAATYVGTAGAMLGFVLTDDPRVAGCVRDCPWAPVIWSSQSAADAFEWVDEHGAYVLVPMFVIALWLRWRRSTPAQRRYLTPLWVAAGILAGVYLISAIVPASPHGFLRLLSDFQALLEICVPAVFLAGLLSARLAQSAVGSLVVDLQAPRPTGELRALIAAALGDPSVDIVYAVDDGGWIQADGSPALLPTDESGPSARQVTVIEREQRRLAALIHDPAVDPGLVRAVAAAAGMAVENERLHAQVRAQLDEVRASRSRIVQAGDDERRRVERDLHDGAQQRLVTLSLAMHAARRQLTAGHPDAVADTLALASDELRLAIDELRELARGLHPVILTDEGLGPALQSLADRAAVPVSVDRVPEHRFPPTIESTVYFVVSEALANIGKYADASDASIHVTHDAAALIVEVRDNGCGGADPARGSGLRGLSDRVAAVNGRMTVVSPVGAGTTVRVVLPGSARADRVDLVQRDSTGTPVGAAPHWTPGGTP